MKSKAFTIIEVLVAVIILATVATMLFQIAQNSKNNYVFYKKKINFENIALFGIVENSLSNTNLYEQIKTKYKIKDEGMRRLLKNIKLKKRVKEYSKIKIDENLIININQVNIKSNKNSSNYFSIGLK